MEEALAAIGGGLGTVLLAFLGYLGKHNCRTGPDGSQKPDRCSAVRLAPEDRDLLVRHTEASERTEKALDRFPDTFDEHRLEMARVMGRMEGRGAVGD